MNVLFGKDEDQTAKSPERSVLYDKYGVDEDYESVNEGMTTDTTEATDRTTRAKEQDAASADGDDHSADGSSKSGDLSGKSSQDKNDTQEGILSSDEEEVLQAHSNSKQSKLGTKPLQQQDITSFGADSSDSKAQADKSLFKNDKEKEINELQYNFGEEDLEKFTSRIETKAKVDKEKQLINESADTTGAAGDEDKNYVACK